VKESFVKGSPQNHSDLQEVREVACQIKDVRNEVACQIKDVRKIAFYKKSAKSSDFQINWIVN
jgi:archaellum component FlaC